MKEIIYTVLSIVLGVFFNACNSKTDVGSVQDSNNWIVLNVEDAKVIDGNISLTFQLKNVGKYNLQIISRGELSSPLSEVKVETGGVVLNEVPKQIFVLGDEGQKQTVSQFKKIIDFTEVGKQTIIVDGGNYLLNIGPDVLVHIPEQSALGLNEMGEWLKINGDAIYGTTRWKTPNEGQVETLLAGTGHRKEKGFIRNFSTEDFWFTAKENKVYAISLVQANTKVKIKALQSANGTVKSVSLLGSSSELKWEQIDEALTVDM